MNADEARRRGLGTARGCLIGFLIVSPIWVYAIGKVVKWW